MKTTAKEKACDLTGRYVRAADGRLYRVTMRGKCPDPWGRPEGDGPVAEIPRPFTTVGAE